MVSLADALLISRLGDGPEIFYSLQGEGASMGKPAVFLRLATCNLSCAWCDTRYAWDWAAFDRDRLTTSLSVAETASALLQHKSRRVVITGGEPLLQQGNLALLCSELKKHGGIIEIETNGTVVPCPDLASLVDQWNVSPKLGSSGVERRLREVARCYSFFRDLGPSYFKFAVRDESDVAEVDSLVGGYRLDISRVILMPVASTMPDLLAQSPWVAEACRARGYTFSTRLHILLWGDRRGV